MASLKDAQDRQGAHWQMLAREERQFACNLKVQCSEP